MPQPLIRVAFVLLPNSLALDWAGPAEALRIANQLLRSQGQPERFALEFVGPNPQVVSSVGLQLAGLLPLPTPPNAPQAPDLRPLWVVLIGMPGQRIPIDEPSTEALLHWLRGLRLAAGQVELVTICADRCWPRTPACWLGGGPPPTTSIWTSYNRWSRAATWWPTGCS